MWQQYNRFLKNILCACDERKKGISEQALGGATPAELQARNLANKRMIFDPEIDPVWNRITSMIGEDAVQAIRDLLIGEDE